MEASCHVFSSQLPVLKTCLDNSTTIALMWDTIAVESCNVILCHQLVSFLEVETGEVDVHTAVATQLNISCLHPYYTYVCVVAAVTNKV